MNKVKKFEEKWRRYFKNSDFIKLQKFIKDTTNNTKRYDYLLILGEREIYKQELLKEIIELIKKENCGELLSYKSTFEDNHEHLIDKLIHNEIIQQKKLLYLNKKNNRNICGWIKA